MALILFSSIGAPILGMDSGNIHEGEEIGEEAWRPLTKIVEAGGLDTTGAQGGEGFALGFDVELFPPTLNLPGANMAREGGEEYECYDGWMRIELNMTEAPTPYLYDGWMGEGFSMTKVPEPEPLSPSPGDWVVNNTEVRENEIMVLTGNLVVESGGNLTLINCTLLMNCTYDGEWQIRVESGGIMSVLEGSNITAYNPNYEFLFYVYGRLIMRDSELHECGYDWDHPRPIEAGMWLETSEGVVIENCKISNCYCGIHCWNSSYITISGCNISQNRCGICCMGSSSITITNCAISQNAWCGVDLFSIFLHENGTWYYKRSSNITITNCTLSWNNGEGIRCRGAWNITITGCDISQNNWDGIYCSADNVLISRCTISKNARHGILCYCSSSLIIADNVFVEDGILLSGWELKHFIHDIRNNTVNGKPLYYILNATTCTIPRDAGQIIIVNSMGVTINGAEVLGAGVGIEIAFSSNIGIEQCIISNNDVGIYCCLSNASISGCTISNNNEGVYCFGARRVFISECTISNNDRGICCEGGRINVFISSCTLSDNKVGIDSCGSFVSISGTDCIISNNEVGIYCCSSYGVSISGCTINNNARCGIYYGTSGNVSISDCTISRNAGCGICCDASENVSISRCVISKNAGCGVWCRSSSGVVIHYCNIYGNEEHGLYVWLPPMAPPNILRRFVVNATYNWWGSPEGPEYKEDGDPEDPEEVYSNAGPEYLLYDPWLTEPYIPPSTQHILTVFTRILTFTTVCLIIIIIIIVISVILWRRRSKKRMPSGTIELS